MSGTDAVWRDELRKRFADREDIGKEQVYEQFFAGEGLPRADVFELLDTIELEFELPAGLLRPTDSLAKLADPVRPRNVWQWMVFQVRSGDRQFVIDDQLTKRLKHFGTNDSWQKIDTIGDLVMAWCGRPPSPGSG